MELVYPTASLSLISTAVPTVLTDPASENHSFTSVYSALPGTVRFVAVKYLLAEEDYYGDSLGAFLTVNFRALTAIPDVLSLLSAARFSVIVGDNDAAEIPSALTVRTSASIIGGQIEGSSGLDCVTDASIQVGSIVTVLDDFFVTGLEKKTSVDDYLGSFSASGGYTYMVLNLDGEQVTSGYVGAGFTIVCMKGGAEVERAIVCLRGDVTGNGSVDVYDAIGAIRDITSGGLTDVRRYASEATLNGKFDVYDAVAVLRYVTRGSVW
ncbi:MAG: hypothetical protein IKX91_02530 [Firmicutes bacterium]|nr:hypothetical protein [Bacillota bacterium]